MRSSFRYVPILMGLLAISLTVSIPNQATAAMTTQIFTKPDDFTDPAARQFAAHVAAGKVPAALDAAESLPRGVNVIGTKGASGLEIAVEHQDKSMIAALLAAGAEPDGAPGTTPVAMAIRFNDLSIARQLLAAGADPNGFMDQNSALQEAALLGATDAIELLLKAGANVNQADELSETAILTTASTDNWATVGQLMDHGASIWPSNRPGVTVALLASDSRVLPNHPEGAALQKVVARLRTAGAPWPPPDARQVRALRDAGRWPPK
ncbi:MAG: ankyrin repeat domain-containing protein [Janthinobacterium lividum]